MMVIRPPGPVSRVTGVNLNKARGAVPVGTQAQGFKRDCQGDILRAESKLRAASRTKVAKEIAEDLEASILAEPQSLFCL